MKNTLETRLGIFFALAMCAAVLLVETIGGAGFFRKGYQVNAYFRAVQDLKVGDPVKLAGVRIGSVSTIQLTNDLVQVSMKIDREQRVRTTSKARIKFAGLMGQNFVELDFGSPDGLLIDTMIGGTVETIEQPDFSTLLARMENVAKGVEDITKSMNPTALQDILGPVSDFMRDNSGRLGGIFGNLQVISDQIAEGKGTIGQMVMDDTLYREAVKTVTGLGESTEKIDGLLADATEVLQGARTTVNDLNAGKGTLGLLVKDEQLYRETTTAMVNLREILEKMNGGQGAIGKLINEEDFLSTLKLTLQKVEKATDSLEDQGPLSVIGLAVGSVF
ncbi:MAG TPA: MCE family protein [Verrucomicrobiales bacterium]|nr:MCE family protein [Verrucomicrobiales bacterium]